MNVLWYYAVAGRVTGPVEWSVLRDAVKSGAVGQDDLVWTPGYGSEWKKASELGLSSAPQGQDGSADESGPAPGKTGAAGGSASGGGTVDSPGGADGEIREKSVFMPENPDEADMSPNPRPSVFRAFCIGAGGVWSMLTSPFSFKRWLSFSIAALMISLGSFVGAVSFGALAETFSGPAHEKTLARLEMSDLARSPLWTFMKRWKTELGQMASRRTPDDSAMARMADDLVSSVRDASGRAVKWWGSAAGELRVCVAAGFALALLLTAYMRAWLVARGRMIAAAHVYRRDAALLFSWDATRRPSALLARALFAVSVAFSAADAAIFVKAVETFASGAPDGEGTLLAFAAAFAATGAARAAATAFALDFAAPRMLLEKTGFLTACRRAFKTLGPWFARYLVLLAVYAAACNALLAPSARSLAVYALLSMPFVMLRIFWALMIAFEIDPALCRLLPPLPDALLKRMKNGGGE